MDETDITTEDLFRKSLKHRPSKPSLMVHQASTDGYLPNDKGLLLYSGIRSLQKRDHMSYVTSVLFSLRPNSL